jgi:hypothetical protein
MKLSKKEKSKYASLYCVAISDIYVNSNYKYKLYNKSEINNYILNNRNTNKYIKKSILDNNISENELYKFCKQ